MILTLIHKHQEVGNAWTFQFKPENEVIWQAGQFLHYTLKHTNPDAEGIKRYFTIASAPSEGHIQITTRITGSTFKHALSMLETGGTIEANEPDGDFTFDGANRKTVLVAGGIGITPYRSILKDRVSKGLDLSFTLVYGNRSHEIIFKDELESLVAMHPELEIIYLTGRPLTLDTLKEVVPDLADCLVYYSGPEPMVEAIGEELRDFGLTEVQLKQDFFPGYTDQNF